MMKMDNNEFFSEATLRICSYLEIEQSMFSCLSFLQENQIPADRIYLQLYEPDIQAMRIIAAASASGGKKLDIVVPLSDQARDELIQSRQTRWNEAMIIDYPETSWIAKHMLRYQDIKATSLLVMRLVSQEQIMGSLVLVAEGAEGYTKEQAALFTLLGTPFVVALKVALEHREVVRLNEILADNNQYLKDELQDMTGHEIVGEHLGLKGVMQMVMQVAPLDSPVLLLGETGVGKDLIANAIHSLSLRRNGPFIKINCGAIPESLIESELFGHEKGAYSGALSQTRGYFERADNGTIFLDEIGELSLQAQVKLLRVIQEKVIERVGGSRVIPVNIRIVAATHRDLKNMVLEAKFREDLWFRLNVFPIDIPPLRERREDIPVLIDHYIARKARELRIYPPPTLAPGAIDLLVSYDWPGNVRELANVIERALILNQCGPLSLENIGLPSQKKPAANPVDKEIGPLLLDEVMSRHIQQVLKITRGKIHGEGGAAELMGINPSTLRNKMKKLGVIYGRKSQGDGIGDKKLDYRQPDERV